MCRARILLAGLTVAVGANGCGWLTPPRLGNASQRDPLLMSHLTHGKNDPTFAGSETGMAFDDESVVQSASVSRKYTPATSQLRSQTLTDVANDHSWLQGTLERREGNRPGWYVRYASASSKDPYGGVLLLQDDPRLGLLRVGDRVFIEGQVEDDVVTGPSYKLNAIRILE